MIIVIGASSFIGTYLTDALASQGRAVFATTRSDAGRRYYLGRGVPCAPVDISRKADLEVLPRKDIEAVILLASLLPANDTQGDPRRYVDVNVTGTLNVLEYCRIRRAGKIIFVSSHSDVAGLWDSGRPITEDDPRSIVYTGDHAVYVITKLAGLDLVEHYHQSYGMAGLSFRLPAVYGYGPHTEVYVDGKARVPGFTTFLRKALRGETLEIWGNPAKGRDLVYVKDVVGAFLGAIDSDKARGLYNIASGVRTSLEEEVRAIVEVFSPPERRSEIRYRPDKGDMPYAYLYDIGKAKRDLGYEVRYPIRAMLEDMKEEMARQRFPHLIERERKG
jgi:UDP-glucose 4-epimerase